MRKLCDYQTKFFTKNILKKYNYEFLNYLDSIAVDNMPSPDYDFEIGEQFIVPGRIEISIDGVKSYIDITSDVLLALYQIVKIRTDEIEDKYEEGIYVDLQEYNE